MPGEALYPRTGGVSSFPSDSQGPNQEAMQAAVEAGVRRIPHPTTMTLEFQVCK